jgi:hypothetical protein
MLFPFLLILNFDTFFFKSHLKNLKPSQTLNLITFFFELQHIVDIILFMYLLSSFLFVLVSYKDFFISTNY